MPQRQTVLPPATAPQFTGFVPLALDILLTDFDDEMFQCRPPKPGKPALNKKQNLFFTGMNRIYRIKAYLQK
jgi:hypothetical protein